MKIDTIKFNNIQPIQTSQRSEGKAATDRQFQNSSAAVTVVSEPVAESIRLAHQDLSQQPDIDQTKVSEIKTALSQGEITVNLQKLAQAMQDYHRR